MAKKTLKDKIVGTLTKEEKKMDNSVEIERDLKSVLLEALDIIEKSDNAQALEYRKAIKSILVQL